MASKRTIMKHGVLLGKTFALNGRYLQCRDAKLRRRLRARTARTRIIPLPYEKPQVHWVLIDDPLARVPDKVVGNG